MNVLRLTAFAQSDLGHSNLNTTRRYVTPNSQDLARAVNSISQTE